MRIAGIDIGTNTILMVAAELNHSNEFKILVDKNSIARLGENLNTTGKIQDSAIQRAVTILKEYNNICLDLGVEKVYAVCTSAMRDSMNSNEVLAIFRDTIQAQFNIIGGKEEARLSFLGTVEDNKPSIVIDIGGGSTEIIYGQGREILFSHSLQIGAVRLTEKYFQGHPPNSEQVNSLREHVRQALKIIPDLSNFSQLYAVAGTPTTLARIAQGLRDYDEQRINGYHLSQDMIGLIINTFLSNEIDYLINNLGIHKYRADVITAGTIILDEILNHFQINNCQVSTKGLRYGVVKDKLNII